MRLSHAFALLRIYLSHMLQYVMFSSMYSQKPHPVRVVGLCAWSFGGGVLATNSRNHWFIKDPPHVLMVETAHKCMARLGFAAKIVLGAVHLNKSG